MGVVVFGTTTIDPGTITRPQLSRLFELLRQAPSPSVFLTPDALNLGHRGARHPPQLLQFLRIWEKNPHYPAVRLKYETNACFSATRADVARLEARMPQIEARLRARQPMSASDMDLLARVFVDPYQGQPGERRTITNPGSCLIS